MYLEKSWPLTIRHLLAMALTIYFPGVPDGILGWEVRTGQVTTRSQNVEILMFFFGDICWEILVGILLLDTLSPIIMEVERPIFHCIDMFLDTIPKV